ncbi:MAG: ribbon-helix-helix protein, CopG family [Pseudomonadota bacterium]
MAAKIISISLPPDLNDEAMSIAKEERRTISEVFREALRQYVASRVVNGIRKQIKRSTKKMKSEDIEDIIDQGRK